MLDERVSGMKLAVVITFLMFYLASVAIGAFISDAQAEETAGKKEKLMSRIDFGNSYIMGQTIKSGAVYLLQRKKSEIKSMLQHRSDYRKEILEDFHVAESDEKVKPTEKEEIK